MKFPSATLIKFFVICVLGLTNDGQVDAAVGLYGPNRYEGLSEICLMPIDFGYCRAKVQRFYFDTRRMKCAMFYWGGCAGNDNNFKSMKECNEYCSPSYGYTSSEELSDSRGNSANTARGSSNSRSVSKFAARENSTSKDTGYKGSSKASAKSLKVDVTSTPTPYSSHEYEYEEYDE